MAMAVEEISENRQLDRLVHAPHRPSDPVLLFVPATSTAPCMQARSNVGGIRPQHLPPSLEWVTENTEAAAEAAGLLADSMQQCADSWTELRVSGVPYVHRSMVDAWEGQTGSGTSILAQHSAPHNVGADSCSMFWPSGEPVTGYWLYHHFCSCSYSYLD
jgi:hypothetical protein